MLYLMKINCTIYLLHNIRIQFHLELRLYLSKTAQSWANRLSLQCRKWLLCFYKEFFPLLNTCDLLLMFFSCVRSVGHFRSIRRQDPFSSVRVFIWCDLNGVRRTRILRCIWWDGFLRYIWFRCRVCSCLLLLCSCILFPAGFFPAFIFLRFCFALGLIARRAVCGFISTGLFFFITATALLSGITVALKLIDKIKSIWYKIILIRFRRSLWLWFVYRVKKIVWCLTCESQQ